LIGKPGSGKTTTLIKFLHNKRQTREISENDFLFISFSNASVDDIVLRAKKFEADKGLKNAFISRGNTKTFHKLAYSVCADKKDINTAILNAIFFLKQLKKGEGSWAKIKLIIVDEAQDMSES
jgi:superfamily I DNA/RNA helicase